MVSKVKKRMLPRILYYKENLNVNQIIFKKIFTSCVNFQIELFWMLILILLKYTEMITYVKIVEQ